MLITLLDIVTQDQSIQPDPDIIIMKLANVIRKIKALKAFFIKFEDI